MLQPAFQLFRSGQMQKYDNAIIKRGTYAIEVPKKEGLTIILDLFFIDLIHMILNSCHGIRTIGEGEIN